MKRVLITGANSFLGDSTKQYLEEFVDYNVDIVDMISDSWRSTDFSQYDVVLNVCAIVHRPKEKNDIYYKVNRDLSLEIANLAKISNVSQFIQISTNGVFGIDLGEMSDKSEFKPRNPYEKSKYEADCLLEEVNDEKFKVCIVRPPLIYGHTTKGNFPKLEKFAKKIPFFPSCKNKKDFIYVRNLCDFFKYLIDNNVSGICYPRDKEVVSVPAFVQKIAKYNNKKMHLWCIFNPFVKLFYRLSRKLRLLFGDNYCTISVLPNNDLSWEPPYSLDEALQEMYEANQ